MAQRRPFTSSPTAPSPTKGSSGPGTTPPYGAGASGTASPVASANGPGATNANNANTGPRGALVGLLAHQQTKGGKLGPKVAGGSPVGRGPSGPRPPIAGQGPRRRPFGK